MTGRFSNRSACACPTLALRSGTILIGSLFKTAGACPKKRRRDEGISTENGRFLAFTRLEEGWSLGFRLPKMRNRLRKCSSFWPPSTNWCWKTKKLYVVRGNAQDKISLLLNRLFSLNTPDDIAYTAIAALNLGYDMTLPRTICLFTLAAQDDEGAVSEGTLHSVINLIRGSESALSARRISSVRSTATRSRYAKRCPIHPSPFNRRCVPGCSSLCASILDLHHIMIQVGVGDVIRSISDYSTQFLDIRQMLRCRTLFNSPETIHFISDFQTEMAIFKIPSAQLDHFLIENREILDTSASVS